MIYIITQTSISSAYPVFAQQSYENPREATRRIVCANCHLTNKPVDVEVPQTVLPDTVFEAVVQIPYDKQVKQVLAIGKKGGLNVGAVLANGERQQDEGCLTNGYLDTPINWVPGMIPLRLKDFPNFIRTTDPNNPLLNFLITEVAQSSKASAIIINTFDALEHNVLNALSSISPPIFTIGPLHLFANQIPQNTSKRLRSNLWKEDPECLKWLDSKQPNSVIYVNFGSIAVLSSQQLTEFARGIAQSKKNFLWVVRPDLVQGENATLGSDYWEETSDRGLVVGWCPQEEVLSHPAVGGFLTHCGWNSINESLASGVPMLCWPFFADQHVNCRYACKEWGVGMEINSDVKRDEVGFLVRELLDGGRGKMMKKRAMEWKEKAGKAISSDGSSYLNLDRLVNEVLIG